MHDPKKEKLIIWTSSKLKKRQNRQGTEQEQICTNYIVNKRLVSFLYIKNSKSSIVKETSNLIRE